MEDNASVSTSLLSGRVEEHLWRFATSYGKENASSYFKALVDKTKHFDFIIGVSVESKMY